MSHKIKYDRLDQPSSPYVSLQISNAKDENFIPKKGKIDTGAYMTVIPEHLIEQLNLKSSTTVKAGGFDSDVKTYDAYFVNIKIGDLVYPYVKVLTQSYDKRKNVLVGRDLLNLWNMNLDGENHVGSFTSFSQNPIDAT